MSIPQYSRRCSEWKLLVSEFYLGKQWPKILHFHAVFGKNDRIIGWRTQPVSGCPSPPPSGNRESATGKSYDNIWITITFHGLFINGYQEEHPTQYCVTWRNYGQPILVSSEKQTFQTQALQIIWANDCLIWRIGPHWSTTMTLVGDYVKCKEVSMFVLKEGNTLLVVA